jgi:hypothetical protein
VKSKESKGNFQSARFLCPHAMGPSLFCLCIADFLPPRRKMFPCWYACWNGPR